MPFTFKKRVPRHRTNTLTAIMVIILHTLVLWCVGHVFSEPVNTSGPRNITRAEGDVDEFIPCPFDGQEYTPFWGINGIIYHTTQLPFPFVTSDNSTAIIIKSITRHLNGTTLQCFVASGSQSDPTPRRSSLGILTVMFDPESDEPIRVGAESVVIELTHRHLHFAQDSVTLAWRVFDKDAGIDLSRPNSQYSLDISDCDPQNVSTNYIVNDTVIMVSSHGLDSNSFMNITLPSQGLSIDERFRIKHGVVTNDIQVLVSGCTCIDVPESNKTTFAAIPHSPTSSVSDFLCLAVLRDENNTLDTCHDLQTLNQCGGGPGSFNTSIYSNSVKLCNDSSGTQFKMCFTNISVGMNNTRIHFFYSQSPKCLAIGKRTPSKLYIASYKIVVKDSGPFMFAATNFNELINSTTGEMCFDTYSRFCSQYAGNKSYDVSISDLTGYLMYKRVRVSPGSCLHTPAHVHSVCAPFSINISTHSHQQSLNSQIHTIASGAAVNPCQCALQNINVSLQIYNNTSESGKNITLRCNHTYITDVKLMIELPPVDSERPQEIIFYCSRQHGKMIENVRCGTVRVSMMLLKFNECALLESDITCKPDLKSTSMDATRLTLSIVLPSLLFLLILVGIIALAVYIAGRKNHKKVAICYDHVDKNNCELTPIQNTITS